MTSGDTSALSGVQVLACVTRHRAEILREVSNGRTNREIASHLGTTESSVSSQLQSLFHFTGCRNRTQLAAWWLANHAKWIESAVQAATPATRVRVDSTDAALMRRQIAEDANRERTEQ